MMARSACSGRPGTPGRELVRLLSAHPEAQVAFTTGTGAATSPTRPASSARPTPTSSRCPTASPPPTPAALRERAPGRRSSIDLSGDLRLPTADAYRDVVRPRPSRPRRCSAARPTACPRSTANASRRAPHLEPRLLRDLGPAAARAAAARAAGGPRRRRGRRQERRHRRRARAARGPALLRGGRQLLRLLARAHPPARRARSRRSWRERRGPARGPHLLPAPAAGEARHPVRALPEDPGARPRPGRGSRATSTTARRFVRVVDSAAAALRRGRHQRLPDLRPRRRAPGGSWSSRPSTTS